MRTRLTEDMKSAMKSGDKERLGTIRLMQAAIKDLDIAMRGQGKETSDTDLLGLLAKMVKQEAEQGRVAIRNVRRDAINDIKELLKDKVINEDQERQGETMIQEITDKHVAEIEKISDEKQKEIMEF